MAQSPTGDNLPLRQYSIQYQPSPSPLTSQASPITSPPPESASSIPLSQVDTESAASLSWKDVTVSFEQRSSSPQVVLDGVAGYAEPYRMLTIMGPSQSGKSTLLRALSGRLCRKAKYQGDIRINGRRQQLTYGTSTFLTPDDEVLPDSLTVKEHLILSAFLRLPSNLPRKEKLAVAEHVMSEMGLTELAYRYVRKCPHKGISGGERRLVNLAVELLIGPSLIYFDDAFKGLEGASVLSLLIKLKGLARGGATVIMCTEHVSSQVYELLDDLCLLSNGKMVFFGDNIAAVEHFSTAGFPCPPNHNPSDHFLYTIGAEFEKLRAPFLYVQDAEKAEAFAKEDHHQIVNFLSASYQSSDFNAALVCKVNTLVKKKGGVLVNRIKRPASRSEFFTLSYRSLLNTTRALGFYWIRILLSFLYMLSIGTIFLRLDHSKSSIEARAACIFLALEGMIYLSVGGVPYMYNEVKMHVREMVNCHYGVANFVVANSIASLPFLLLISLVPLCSMYFLAGLHSGALKFIYFVVNLYLSLIVSESLMMAISCIVPNAYTGMILGSCVQVLFMLVGGYVRHDNNLPKAFWKYPSSYISFHAHSLRVKRFLPGFQGLLMCGLLSQGMFQNEFLGSRYGGHTGAYIVYGEYNFPASPGKWWSLLILAGMAIFYRTLSVVLIRLSYRVRSLTRTCIATGKT
ncbi:ABC transporter G family member 11 isoform X1 [Selaginella moellendorffii]|uniref:ABC transporter G family member 11 isoform X1 n=1 Tax=Selaginella moellendorffii TaxID=88036 RepID=UPI000D1C9FE3|nr:ABC transporter G family member 11 isoform X1 [Selaginella moellendorffii]|eukprot:XP_024526458.1 ABC transporter G family member 11 isoform X1 [Selaginella moellendorffii]